MHVPIYSTKSDQMEHLRRFSKQWLRFFGFAGRKPVVVYNRQGPRLICITIGAPPAYADLAEFQPRRGRGEACFAS